MTTRNARTSSASSVRSSSTRSDASRTTSRRRYSSPAPVCLLHDHIPDSSYQFPASDYQRGPEAAGVHTTQDIADGRYACLSTEGLRGSLRTGHHYTRQLVTADLKVPSTLQISAGAAATEEGGARQVVASQLQADIELINSLQGAPETHAGKSASPPHQLHKLQQAAVGLQARTFDRDGAARCP